MNLKKHLETPAQSRPLATLVIPTSTNFWKNILISFKQEQQMTWWMTHCHHFAKLVTNPRKFPCVHKASCIVLDVKEVESSWPNIGVMLVETILHNGMNPQAPNNGSLEAWAMFFNLSNQDCLFWPYFLSGAPDRWVWEIVVEWTFITREVPPEGKVFLGGGVCCESNCDVKKDVQLNESWLAGWDLHRNLQKLVISRMMVWK